MFAILLGALAPTISHAMARASGQDTRWIEVCTVAGIRMMLADDASADPAQDDPGALPAERCPYCGTHAGSFGLPPVPAVSGFTAAADTGVAGIHPPRAQRPLFARGAAQPRAPPIPA